MLSPDPPETGLWWSGVQDLGILGFQFGGWLRASGLWGFGFHGFRLLVQRALEVESLEDGSSRISQGLAFAGFSIRAPVRGLELELSWRWAAPMHVAVVLGFYSFRLPLTVLCCLNPLSAGGLLTPPALNA